LTDNPPTATTLVFIDSAVQDSADIISAIDPTAEIVYLDAKKDGLTQIADYLEGRSDIDNIQIISHGNQAALHLGNEILTNDNLADHTDELATIGKSLTVNGDILLYGCELANLLRVHSLLIPLPILRKLMLPPQLTSLGRLVKTVTGRWNTQQERLKPVF